MNRRAWRRPAALFTASLMWLAHATPALGATQHLRPEDTGESGIAQQQIRGDTAWVWGPLGANPIDTLGRENLVSLAKEGVAPAFEQGRAFELFGPGVRPIEELVEIFAIGYQLRRGKPLPEAERDALTQELTRLKRKGERIASTISISVPAQTGEVAADRVVRFVFILDELGRPALIPAGVQGNPTHYALTAYGGFHQYPDWRTVAHPAFGAKSSYFSLEQFVGMLDQGLETALQALPRTEFEERLANFKGAKEILAKVRFGELIDVAEAVDQLTKQGAGRELAQQAVRAEVARRVKVQDILEQAQLGSLEPDETTRQLTDLGAPHEAAEPAVQEAREGFDVAKLKLVHEVNDVAVRGHHEDEPQDIEGRVNAVIGKVFEQVEQAKAKQRDELVKASKEAARSEAAVNKRRVQIVPYLVDLGQFFEGNRPPTYVLRAIEARLEQAAREGRITASRVKPLGHKVLLEVHYNGPERNPAVDRLVIDLITEVIAREVGQRSQDTQRTLILLNGAVEEADAVMKTWRALQALVASDVRSFREIIRKSRSPYYVLDEEASRALQAAGLLVGGQIPDAVRDVVLSGTEGLDPYDRRETFRLTTEVPIITDGRLPRLMTEAAQTLASLPYAEHVKRLLKGPNGNFAFNHGSSDPVGVFVALGGGPAAFNWQVMRLLDEAVQNQLKIEGIRAQEVKALQAVDQKKDKETLQKIFELERELKDIKRLRADVDKAKADVEQLRALREKGEELAEALKRLTTDLAKEAETEGPGYVVVIERIEDILAGKRERTAYRFVYPRSAPYIHTFVDDQTEWVITKVLPRPGSRRYNINKSPADQDPMLAVMVDPVEGALGDQESIDPILVSLMQSGFPALGEDAAMASQFYITTTGPREGTRHRGAIPVTAEEADSGAFADRGLVRIVADMYMSYGTTRVQDKPGLIPHAEVHDQVGMTSDIRAVREEKLWVADELAMMGTFQPAVTAPEAERRAHQAVHELGNRYHEIPSVIVRGPDGKPKLGPSGKPLVKLDSILEASNRKAAMTVHVHKADIGATGHQSPYALEYAAFKASFNVAKRRGLLDDYRLGKTVEGGRLVTNYDLGNQGDDNHFILFSHRGVDDPDIHALTFTTFFRAGWLIHQLGYQLYGDMQDFVDPEIKKIIERRELHRYAQLDDEFMEELKKELEWMPEAGRWREVQQGYERVKAGISSGEILELRPPGNVTGLGMAFAEKTVSQEEIERFRHIAIMGNDKAASGAFNFGIYWALRLSMLLKKVYVEKAIPRTAGRQEVRAALEQEVAERMPDTPAALRKEVVQRLLEAGGDLTPEDAQKYADWIQHGIVVETWDVAPGSRAFVEVEREDPQLLSLLSAQNEHNIKRIWVKKRSGWIDDLTAEEVAAIERKVDQELRDNRTLFEERKAQLREEVTTGKRKLEVLNPWERMLHDQDIDTVIAAVRPRFIEVYKVRMFLGDDYLASASTEKLAAVTMGQYVGKDDSVMIAIEAFAALYRGIAKRFVRFNVGNARGSHWVAMRPERAPVIGGISKSAVAVQWSNPIEIAYRYELNADGTVATDAKTGLARREDMYGSAEFDPIRTKVSKANLIWIQSQGGFTPHGPAVKWDVEIAYPIRQTLDGLIRPGSPFGVAVDDATITKIKQGALAGQYPEAMDYAMSQDVAAQGVDPSARWVAVHWSAYDVPDTAIAQERIQAQLRERSGLPWVLIVDGVTSAEDAEEKAAKLFAGIPEASAGRNRLTREQFTLVLPGLISHGDLLGRLEAAKPGSRLGAVVGPKEWAQALKDASPEPQTVAAIALEPTQEVSGGRAIIAGVEAAAAGGKLPPALVAKFDDLDGVLVPQGRALVDEEVAVAVRAHQEKMRAIRAAGKA